MDEIHYTYDWRHPIEVPNPKNKSGVSKENGSFKWFQYWLEKGCTYKQIADYFNTSETNVQSFASLFKWSERKKNKEDYTSRQREKIQLARYKQFIDTDYNNATTQLNALYTLSQIALIFLGVLPDNNALEIPEDMDVNKAIKILQGNPQAINKMHQQVLRDLEKSGTINDKQKIESENINTNLNIPLKTTDEVLDENADTITRFIERRMHTTDSTTD
jgi:hypothetical protein